MLEIQDFFAACVGTWKTERTYHYPLHNEVERSYTEFNVGTLASVEKHQISLAFLPVGSIADLSEIWAGDERNEHGADVLNGISVSQDEDLLYITGKQWDRMFLVK